MATQTQVKLIAALLFVCGVLLLARAAWLIYPPACPAMLGLGCVHFARSAWAEAKRGGAE